MTDDFNATQSPLLQSAIFQSLYTYIDEISTTPHSHVRLCKMKDSGKKVAVKIVDLKKIPEYAFHTISSLQLVIFSFADKLNNSCVRSSDCSWN